MATEFAITRFLVPFLTDADVAVFADAADMLCLADIDELFRLADPAFAVQVVKRDWKPVETTKMDGVLQVPYPRKGWSSLMVWNLRHPANARLTLDMVNTLPGRDLHAFCWLKDQEIGDLPMEWNLLAGVDHIKNGPPKLIHYTSGSPELLVDSPWSDEWKGEAGILQASLNRVRA